MTGFKVPDNDAEVTRRDAASLTEAGKVEEVDIGSIDPDSYKGPPPSEESMRRWEQLTSPGVTEADLEARERDPAVRERRERAAAEAARRAGVDPN